MRVEEQILIDASPEEVWRVIEDFDRYDRLVAGITRWESEDRRRHGQGSRYQMRMEVGSAQVGSLIEIVEWDPPGDMAWNSVTGLDQRGRWRLRQQDDGQTKASLRLSYQAPGGLLGLVSDRVSSPMVRGNLRETLKRVKQEVEGEGHEMSQETPGLAQRAWTVAGRGIHAARTFYSAGMIAPDRPDRLVGLVRAIRRWGNTPAAGYAAAAVRYPDEDAIIDELGRLTFAEIDDRTNRLANAFADAGIVEGDQVGLMCRNHRGFIEATVALAKLGCRVLYLNTAFAGPQLAEVVKREKPKAIVYDEEFAELLADAGKRRKRFIAWHDSEKTDDPTLDQLIEEGDPEEPVPPSEDNQYRAVILTSGTTGTPKGASRSQPTSILPAAAMLDRIPLRARERTLIAAPLFHSWGFTHFTFGMLLSSTIVLQRKFDPEQTLAGIAQHKVQSCPMVPVMVQRIMQLPEETRKKYDTSSLTSVPLSGSALPGELAIKFMDEFGDVLQNLYGSTEVAWAAIATAQDLRAAPGTAGKPPVGTIVRIYDQDRQVLPQGEVGRIFVGNEMLFEGYTGGGSKDVIDGLMSTGDMGYLDEEGRLFVTGRDDEMIVSGGENVFPREVEDLIAKMSGVKEAAVIGVDDEKFGQRLKAYVVTGNGGPSEDEIKNKVKSDLARYKVPREVEFLDELPRNATGKVLKKELKEMHEGAEEGSGGKSDGKGKSERKGSGGGRKREKAGSKEG